MLIIVILVFLLVGVIILLNNYSEKYLDIHSPWAILGYNTINIGDDIQSFVASKLFNPEYAVLRDDYEKVYDLKTGKRIVLDEPIKLLMNGWFMHSPDNFNGIYNSSNIKFPYDESLIHPVYFATHINPSTPEMMSPKCIKHFRKYEPIKTRDSSTAERLREKGVKAEVVGCMTQRLRPEHLDYKGPIQRDLIIYVDYEPKDIVLPLHSANFPGAVKISHERRYLAHMNPKERMEEAHNLLTFYFSRAKKIYTTRLHCYLPCKALGLDVEYLGVIDDRTKDFVR